MSSSSVLGHQSPAVDPLAAQDFPQWQPHDAAGGGAGSSPAGVVKRAAFFMGILALAFLAGNTLYGTNTAAQASWAARSQIGGQRDARRIELQQAVVELEGLHESLLSSYAEQGVGSVDRVAWSLRWRERLGEVPVSVRNYAPIAMAPKNVHAEQALRTGRLYLSSMEGAMAMGRGQDKIVSLEQSFFKALNDARALVS